MSAAAENLAAIQSALDLHEVKCGRPPLAILMNPFEVDRLGWDDYLGIPIEPDEETGTGKVFIACQEHGAEAEAEEAQVIKLEIQLNPATA